MKLSLAAACLLLAANFLGKRNANVESVEEGAASAASTTPDMPVAQRAPVSTKPQPAAQRGRQPGQAANVGEARFAVSADGRSLRIVGGVGRNFATDLRKTLEAHPYLQRIDITSGGGYASSGLEAARLIRQYSLKMRVRSHCASMCVGLWAAAAQREMEADAVVGLHGWDAQCDTLAEPDRRECAYAVRFWTEHDKIYDSWLGSAGFNDRLLELQDKTPSSDIAVLNALQLWDNGVDFSVVDADGRRMAKADVQEFLAKKNR